jgi:hypothetical protein
MKKMESRINILIVLITFSFCQRFSANNTDSLKRKRFGLDFEIPITIYNKKHLEKISETQLMDSKNFSLGIILNSTFQINNRLGIAYGIGIKKGEYVRYSSFFVAKWSFYEYLVPIKTTIKIIEINSKVSVNSSFGYCLSFVLNDTRYNRYNVNYENYYLANKYFISTAFTNISLLLNTGKLKPHLSLDLSYSNYWRFYQGVSIGVSF